MVLEAISLAHRAPPDEAREDNAQGAHPISVVHIAVVVPDIRLYQIVKDKFVVVQPPYHDLKVQLHVLVDDKTDPFRDLEWPIRIALVESGLVLPEDVRITYPEQVTLGWPKPGDT